MAERRRVVVTGIGCITAIGEGVDGLWAGLHRGTSGIVDISRFDPTPFRTRIAAEVRGFDPADRLGARRARRLDRYSAMALCSAATALENADLDPATLPPDRVTVQMGSALGGVGYAEEQHVHFMERGVRGVNPLLALSVFGGASSCNIAIEYGFTGPNLTNAMSCASGALAIGQAFRLIRDGVVDLGLAGGAEAPLAPLCFGSFALIRAMSTRNANPGEACRPFDAGRDGFVMGEGAAILLLEELGHALRRDAPIYGELRGFGTTNDAYHMTAPRPGGTEAARAMSLALDDAGVGPSAVDYVNAHGSSTPLNDAAEAEAIRSVFGERTERLRVSATKAYYGHALGASGAIEAAITLLGLKRDWLAPSLNLERPGEGCELRFVGNGGETYQAGYVLTNSFGFGGINASLLLRRYSQ
ncbi:MAG: beta-ketoacyl-[acyl-carrier-protein] synthase family protein [Gemmatimonadota bacterium]